jgi:hypothetical protein
MPVQGIHNRSRTLEVEASDRTFALVRRNALYYDLGPELLGKRCLVARTLEEPTE